ncbi:MAG: hypothetical protein Q9169_002888 [Polycauliona sp. 2 TL-2023]
MDRICKMTVSVLIRSACLLLVLGLFLFRFTFSTASSSIIIDALLYQSAAILGYLAVFLVWADLIWVWVVIPIQRSVKSLAPLGEAATDLGQGVCDLYLSIHGLLHRAPSKILDRLASLYFYPIDRDAGTDKEPKQEGVDQATRLSQQEWHTTHNLDCPWNESYLWSYIESENDEDLRPEDHLSIETSNTPEPHNPPTEDHIAIETGTAPEPRPLDLELSQDCVSTTTCGTVDSLSTITSAKDPGPPCDAITLRARPSNAAPRSPTINDNLAQISKMKAAMDSPAASTSLQRLTSKKCFPNAKKIKASPLARNRLTLNRQQYSTTVVDKDEDFVSTPDLGHEDDSSAASDESDSDDWEPLVSTAVPMQAIRERWAVVFDNAKDKDEELDRFEAALGRGVERNVS